jgi:hypothetical protein
MLRAIPVIVVGIGFWSGTEDDLGREYVSRRCGCVLVSGGLGLGSG